MSIFSFLFRDLNTEPEIVKHHESEHESGKVTTFIKYSNGRTVSKVDFSRCAEKHKEREKETLDQFKEFFEGIL